MNNGENPHFKKPLQKLGKGKSLYPKIKSEINNLWNLNKTNKQITKFELLNSIMIN